MKPTRAVNLNLSTLIFWLIVLIWAAAMGLLWMPSIHSQEKPCGVDPHSEPPKPPVSVEYPVPVDFEKVASYGCFIQIVPHITELATYNARTKKPEIVQQERTEYELTLQMKNSDGVVLWKFGPVLLDDEASAYTDCSRWKAMTKARIKESQKHGK